MANDFDVLRHAYEREKDPRSKGLLSASWDAYSVGASRDQVQRLLDEGMVTISYKSGNMTKYRLTDKGHDLVWAQIMERKMDAVPAKTILEAMDLIVGFDDLKDAIAHTIEARRRMHYLLSGPPACSKSLILEGVRSAVPTAYIVFGSRTSASGLSEVLFQYQPTVLLFDEVDKVHMDVYSVLLGLMESGEILETKSGRTRGIKLDCSVIAACNRYEKMPPEFLSRFALHAAFPHYTRDEFIEVCKGFLPRAEGCPVELAEKIGTLVFDYGLGDVRKARGVWQLMKEATADEATRAVQLMLKYRPDGDETRAKAPRGQRLL